MMQVRLLTRVVVVEAVDGDEACLLDSHTRHRVDQLLRVDLPREVASGKGGRQFLENVPLEAVLVYQGGLPVKDRSALGDLDVGLDLAVAALLDEIELSWNQILSHQVLSLLAKQGSMLDFKQLIRIILSVWSCEAGIKLNCVNVSTELWQVLRQSIILK